MHVHARNRNFRGPIWTGWVHQQKHPMHLSGMWPLREAWMAHGGKMAFILSGLLSRQISQIPTHDSSSRPKCFILRLEEFVCVCVCVCVRVCVRAGKVLEVQTCAYICILIHIHMIYATISKSTRCISQEMYADLNADNQHQNQNWPYLIWCADHGRWIPLRVCFFGRLEKRPRDHYWRSKSTATPSESWSQVFAWISLCVSGYLYMHLCVFCILDVQYLLLLSPNPNPSQKTNETSIQTQHWLANRLTQVAEKERERERDREDSWWFEHAYIRVRA